MPYMLSGVRARWWRVKGSLWFIPSLMVAGAVVLAVLMIEAQSWFDLDLDERWPRLFGAGVDGSREMLAAVATSMITVAGVVFSVTIVALSLSASQYSPRVLRTFMGDRPTQLVLGVLMGIFAYSLTVLRTIRSRDDDDFVPALAVLGAILLAFIGIGFLVFFIHHLAASVQASAILSRVTAATRDAIDELFPENLGAPADEAEREPQRHEPGAWTPVAARGTGYVVTVNNDGLLDFSRRCGRVLRMHAGIGDFVVRGQAIAWLEGSQAVSEADEKALNSLYSCEAERTIEQDAAFGIQEIVDIGLKGLSPSINDQTTAIMCIDRLTEILVHLARRHIATPLRRDEGRLRVIASGPSFESLTGLAYDAVRSNAGGKHAVLLRLLWSIDQVAAAATNPARLRILAVHVKRTAEVAERTLAAPHQREELKAHAARLLAWLERPKG